jgi:hypothetical protein
MMDVKQDGLCCVAPVFWSQLLEAGRSTGLFESRNRHNREVRRETGAGPPLRRGPRDSRHSRCHARTCPKLH